MIGILGGSFDPPHNGHRFISQYAMMRLNLQEVWWIVTYKNPLKKKSNSYNYRIKQVKNFIKFKRIKILKIKEDKNIHLMGLLSDGGVHSHINHLKGLINFISLKKKSNVFLHAFTDGRDVDPYSCLTYLKDIEEHMINTTGKLATVIGRFFSMDRDNRFERIKEVNLMKL